MRALACHHCDRYFFLPEQVQEPADIREWFRAHIVQVFIEAKVIDDTFFIMFGHEGHDSAFFGGAEGGDDLCVGQRLQDQRFYRLPKSLDAQREGVGQCAIQVEDDSFYLFHVGITGVLPRYYGS